MIEALIAAAILLLIAIGILPLFTRSILNNVLGSEMSQTSNHGRSRAETFYQLNWTDPSLAIASGSTITTVDDFWGQGVLTNGIGGDTTHSDGWLAASSGRGLVVFRRRTDVQQYWNGDLATALDGGISADFAHIKLITVRTQNFDPAGTLSSSIFSSSSDASVYKLW